MLNKASARGERPRKWDRLYELNYGLEDSLGNEDYERLLPARGCKVGQGISSGNHGV